jgi:hypothetical protein
MNETPNPKTSKEIAQEAIKLLLSLETREDVEDWQWEQISKAVGILDTMLATEEVTLRDKLALNRGAKWLSEHREHVQAIVARNPIAPAIKPTGEDLLDPRLWKAIHWKWYMTHRPV